MTLIKSLDSVTGFGYTVHCKDFVEVVPSLFVRLKPQNIIHSQLQVSTCTLLIIIDHLQLNFIYYWVQRRKWFYWMSGNLTLI